MQQQYIEIE